MRRGPKEGSACAIKAQNAKPHLWIDGIVAFVNLMHVGNTLMTLWISAFKTEV